MAWLAQAHLLAGQMDQARRRAEQALNLSRTRGQRGYEALALYVLGEIETREHGAGPSAATLYRDALTLADEVGMRPLAGRCRMALGQPSG